MNNNAELQSTVPLIKNLPNPPSQKFLTRVLGRDWKIALIFVLPLIIIMGGLIVWPFVNAINLSMTVRSLATRTPRAS